MPPFVQLPSERSQMPLPGAAGGQEGGLQEQAAVAHWAEDPVLVAAQDPGPECTTLALQYPG